MASNAHAFHPDPYDRQRRPLRFQIADPTEPRTPGSGVNRGLIAAAAAAALMVAGATYAVYYNEPAPLAETQAAPLEREYQPLVDFAQANASKALSGSVASAPATTEPVNAVVTEPTVRRIPSEVDGSATSTSPPPSDNPYR
jgi:hypothetical protein